MAREAGVGKGTIYRNFVDKDDLLFQMATSGFDELCDILKQKIPENGRFEQKLLRACKHISRFFAGRRQLFQVMQSDTAQIYWPRGKFHNKWMQQRHKLVSAVANILSEGVRERVVRSDISADVLAAFLLGMLRTRGRELPEVSESVKSHELLVNIFLKGAGPNLEDSCE